MCTFIKFHSDTGNFIHWYKEPINARAPMSTNDKQNLIFIILLWRNLCIYLKYNQFITHDQTVPPMLWISDYGYGCRDTVTQVLIKTSFSYVNRSYNYYLQYLKFILIIFQKTNFFDQKCFRFDNECSCSWYLPTFNYAKVYSRANPILHIIASYYIFTKCQKCIRSLFLFIRKGARVMCMLLLF